PTRSVRRASAAWGAPRTCGRARRARRRTTGPPAPRASRRRARRAPGSASRGRSVPRTRRTNPSRSSRRRDEGAHLRLVLDPRLALESRRCVDGPRPNGANRFAHVVGAELSGEHHAPFDRGRAFEVEGIVLLPGEIDDAGNGFAL